ncbi:MAG: nucleotidyltransferase family protein, partial [Bacteroidales bacterium]|nr:nucleotidyltransferase family protein [Bacteroidales bacterium]
MEVEKHIQDVFLSLLRSALWGVPAQIPDGFSDWRSVAVLAKSQSVLGLVGEELMSCSAPKELKAKVRTMVMRTVMTHAKLNSVLAEVTAALEKGGVPSVLLKGQGIAAYYPKPELRQCGDIDLYVGQKEYARSYEILRQTGASMEDSKALTVGKHYHASYGQVEVEVHRYTEVYPFRKYDDVYQNASDAGMTEGLVPMSFGGVTVATPEDTFNAFFIFSHLFHHFLTSGIGLRQFCDWMMLLSARKEEIDHERLAKILTDMDMMKPWQAFGCVLVEHLGL